MTINKFACILIVFSVIGLFASFFLSVDTFRLLENPKAELPCNLSPFVSCSSVINSPQGKIFGFPNPLLGIIAFSALFTAGLNLLNAGRPGRNFWKMVNYGNGASMIFVVWFFYQSLYQIGSLCIYCITVWVSVWPIFLYTLVWSEKEKYIKFNEKLASLIHKNHLVILITGYLLAILLILIRFREFFFA